MRTVFKIVLIASAAVFICTPASAQTVQTLNLQQAEQTAIQNHPQIQSATALAGGSGRGTGAGSSRFILSKRQPHRSRSDR
jgi:hypothetical protein